LYNAGLRFNIGSPLFTVLLNSFGANISHSAFVFTTDLPDLDLIEIGDGAAIERDAVLVPHKRERDFMEFNQLRIGAGCSIRCHSMILYNVVVEKDVELLPLSVAIPGQKLLEGRTYGGVPCGVVRNNFT